MNQMTKNILAVVLGFVVGSLVNMGLVSLGPNIIPLPVGADVSTMDGLKASMLIFEPKHFVFPFLAHALGTLAGAFVAAKMAASHHHRCAMIIGVLFLLGGMTMVYLAGGPGWFIATDLILAYLPMAYLGSKLAGTNKK